MDFSVRSDLYQMTDKLITRQYEISRLGVLNQFPYRHRFYTSHLYEKEKKYGKKDSKNKINV